MIYKALESDCTPKKLAMRIFFSSVAQLEAEISIYFHVGGGYVGPPFIPVLIEI